MLLVVCWFSSRVVCVVVGLIDVLFISAESIEKVDLSFVREHAGSVMDGSPVGYVRNAVPRGIIFDGDDSSGLVCGADSEFFVDRTEPLKVLESVRRDFWPLGELPAGHEFLLLLRPARRWDHRTET